MNVRTRLGVSYFSCLDFERRGIRIKDASVTATSKAVNIVTVLRDIQPAELYIRIFALILFVLGVIAGIVSSYFFQLSRIQ